MVEYSAGKKLSGARLAKGLSIDEAAHSTKMRPDKILALENDDLSRFGSPAYAKGFLLIYSRFLGVDVAEELRDFQVADSRVNVEDYQYLSNAPEPEEPQNLSVRRLDSRRPPSVLPLVAFVLVCLLAGVVFYIMKLAERLQMNGPAATVSASSERPKTQLLPPVGELEARSSTAPARRPEAPEPAAVGEFVAISPGPATEPDATAPLPTEIPLPVEPVATVNEVIVEPLKKAWVKIRRDTPDSAPIFEGDLYPGVRPLKLKGTRFFVEVRDQSSVQIRKNGQPIAYQAPGISIQ